MSAAPGITILIADDQAMVRAGFRSLLGHAEDLSVVAEAANGEEAIHQARQHCPDVILMDIRMPVLDGLAATRRIIAEQPGSKVVILTTFDLDEHVFEALRSGASGFLLKDAPAEELVRAVRTVAGGAALLDPAVTRRVIEVFAAQPSSPGTRPAARLDILTARERDVLALVARGLTNAEIAGELVISEATAKTHVSNLLTKLDLRDRVQAVVTAYETGFVRGRLAAPYIPACRGRPADQGDALSPPDGTSPLAPAIAACNGAALGFGDPDDRFPEQAKCAFMPGGSEHVPGEGEGYTPVTKWPAAHQRSRTRPRYLRPPVTRGSRSATTLSIPPRHSSTARPLAGPPARRTRARAAALLGHSGGAECAAALPDTGCPLPLIVTRRGELLSRLTPPPGQC